MRFAQACEASLRTEKDRLEREVRSLEAQVSDGKEASTELERKLKEKQERLRTVDAELSQAKEKLEELEKDQSVLKEKLKNKEKDLEEMRQSYMDALKEKVCYYEARISECLKREQADNEALQRKCAAWKDDLKAERSQAKDQIAGLKKEQRDLQEQLEKKGQELEEMQHSATEMQNEMYGHKEKILELTKDLQSQQMLNAALQEKCAEWDLKARLSPASDTIEELRKEQSDLKEQLENKRKKLEEMRQKFMEAVKKSDDHEVEVEISRLTQRMGRERAAAAAELSGLKAELAQARRASHQQPRPNHQIQALPGLFVCFFSLAVIFSIS